MKTFFSFLRKIFPPQKGLVSTDTKKSKKYITSYDVFISKKTEDSKMAHEVCSFWKVMDIDALFQNANFFEREIQTTIKQ